MRKVCHSSQGSKYMNLTYSTCVVLTWQCLLNLRHHTPDSDIQTCMHMHVHMHTDTHTTKVKCLSFHYSAHTYVIIAYWRNI